MSLAIDEHQSLAPYLVFEGGGAKGIAHVGALRCLEKNRNMRPAGVAGTSAGAITAALVAAGYRADALYNLDAPVGSRGILEEGFSAILSYDALEDAERKLRAMAAFEKAPLFQKARHAWLARQGKKLLQRVFLERGLISIHPMRDWIEERLREKLRGAANAGDGPVRFSELPLPLKIAATDLTHRTMTVFSTPKKAGDYDPIVADAAVASGCIPFVFFPFEAENGEGKRAVMVDGGLCSNFPFWLFESERKSRSGHRNPVIGIRLSDPESATVAKDPGYDEGMQGTFSFLQDALVATTSGADDAGLVNVRNVYVLTLPVDAGTLAFRKVDDNRETIIRKAYTDTVSYMQREPRLADPAPVKDALETFHQLACSTLGIEASACLRANIMVPISDKEHMVYFHHNMDADPDDRLTLSLDIGLASKTYHQANLFEPHVQSFSGPGDGGLDKYQTALVRQDLKTIVSIPIRPPTGSGYGEVVAVLNFDCNEDVSSKFRTDEGVALWKRAGAIVSRTLLNHQPAA